MHLSLCVEWNCGKPMGDDHSWSCSPVTLRSIIPTTLATEKFVPEKQESWWAPDNRQKLAYACS